MNFSPEQQRKMQRLAPDCFTVFDFQLAQEIIAIATPYCKTPEAARRLLFRYHASDADFEAKLQSSRTESIQYLPVPFYWALQVLSCQGMADSHSNDIKRDNRRQGRKLRLKRTGSRK